MAVRKPTGDLTDAHPLLLQSMIKCERKRQITLQAKSCQSAPLMNPGPIRRLKTGTDLSSIVSFGEKGKLRKGLRFFFPPCFVSA